jgi:RNA polymerase sigma factor (TIGR02999 family)
MPLVRRETARVAAGRPDWWITRDDITLLLRRMRDGEGDASKRLFEAVYDALRWQARGAMRGRRNGNTLQPTALAHEAFLKLVDCEKDWESRAHFLGTAARIMRHILVDHARTRSRQKRTATGRRVDLDDVVVSFEDRALNLVGLDTALRRLAKKHSRAARVVELRFFGGLEWRDVAESVGEQLRTVERDWTYAKTWLQAELHRM